MINLLNKIISYAIFFMFIFSLSMFIFTKIDFFIVENNRFIQQFTFIVISVIISFRITKQYYEPIQYS